MSRLVSPPRLLVLPWLWTVCAAGFLATGSAWSQEDATQPADQPAEAAEVAKESLAKPSGTPAAEVPKPPTAEVKKGTIKITLDLEGIVEAVSTREIVVRPEEWAAPGGLVVENVVKHGARVKKDEVLVSFDSAKIDRAIEDLRTEVKIGRLSLQQAEQQLQALEETTPIDLAANQRAARMAEEDRKYYFDKQRPFDERLTEFQLHSAQNSLEYAQEEFAQLKKMYEADDLTEETEAIVLKRAQNSVESAKMQVESSQMRRDLALQFTLPREEERVKESSLRRRSETQRAAINLPLALEKQRLEVAKLNQQQLRSQERLEKLEADRERMKIKSPADGIVYYGKATRGKFSDSTPLAENLRPLGSVQPNQVLMTVVQPQPVSIRATVPEDKLYRLRIGLTGAAVPKAYPNLRLPAVVSAVSPIPLGPGSFEALLKLSRSKQDEALLPGMACTVTLEPYVKHDALYVPPKAVMTDDVKADQQFVYVLKDGTPVRRNVTVGERTDAQAEILKGVSEGERVLLEAPNKQ